MTPCHAMPMQHAVRFRDYILACRAERGLGLGSWLDMEVDRCDDWMPDGKVCWWRLWREDGIEEVDRWLLEEGNGDIVFERKESGDM